jgi:cytochrome b561
MNNPRKFPDPLSISLHWLVALGILGLLIIGYYMTWNQVWSLYHWHKSLGILLLVAIVIRSGWRLLQGWPAADASHSPLERRLARLTQWLLLISSLLMPLTGMLYSGASGHGFALFGLHLVPDNPHPDIEWEVIPYSQHLSDLGQTAHELVSYLLCLALLMHLAGALKHHFIDRDNTLRAMLRPGDRR